MEEEESFTLNFIQLVPNGHGFAKAQFSDQIDIFGYQTADYHNGPRCVFCHEGFCHHCSDSHETAICSQTPFVVYEKPKTKEVEHGSQM